MAYGAEDFVRPSSVLNFYHRGIESWRFLKRSQGPQYEIKSILYVAFLVEQTQYRNHHRFLNLQQQIERSIFHLILHPSNT
mmetsp:Transcript_7448/g.13467  ORF Transcript_7448/g.13467 Transcript_7448/m.13467 type:complete len:81 (+) Transcript_7448:896-1138(+)